MSKFGWAWPPQSRKQHYFGEDRRALCGKWAWFGELGPDPIQGVDRCAGCSRRIDAATARIDP